MPDREETQEKRSAGIENVWLAASAQVAHWEDVLTEWKAMLGEQWERTYAASNAISVTRRNNILFSILAQFMGEGAMNHRCC